MIHNKQIKDLTGLKFGRLTVLGIDDKPGYKTYWNCQCECGNVKSVRSDSLQCGAIKSCGCLKAEYDKINLAHTQCKETMRRRGYKSTGTRLYNIWSGIKKRCLNERDASYDRYGGRGITVCDEWKNSFEAFHDWALSHGYADDLTIDRIDNSGDYCPENCRWATTETQCRNRRSNIIIKIGNSSRTLKEWCEIFDVDYQNANARYHRNGFVSIDDLFNGERKMNQS